MLKIMLVDDEPIIRKGIRTSIAWEKYDIKIVGEASNGADALKKAVELRPHIVITDIRMPIMDGLALSGSLKKQFPDTRIIILSGYDDFSYAKKALSLGVNDYLLKPVGAEDLVSLIIKLKEDIIKEQLERDRNLSTSIVFNENFPHIKSNFINKLLKGEYTAVRPIYNTAETLKLNLPGPEHLVFVISIDDFLILTEDMTDKDKELLKFSVMNISEELLLSSVSGLLCYSEFEHIIGLISAENLTEAHINSLCKDIQCCIRKYLKLSVSIGVGKSYKNILDMPKSYSEALTALRDKIFKGKNSIIFFSSLDNTKKPVDILYPLNEEKEMISYLNTLNIDGLKSALDNIFTKFTSSYVAPENIKNICSRLIVITISYIEEMGINIQGNLGANFNPYREVEKFDVLEDLHKWMESFFKRMVIIIKENKTSKFKGIIKVALEYIEENYHKDLSLSEVASIVYVTPNYLSRIFKEEMNVNFVNWVNQFRTEKAKAFLIESNAKTYEIAEKVGYRDYKYFSYIFKKFTGCTPAEFRERNIIGF